MNYESINFKNKLEKFDQHWSPRIVGEMNDYQFKLVKVKGDFIWHDHPDTDETFIVLEGELRIDFREGAVTLKEGEMYVIPKGIEHKPFAQNEASIMIIEPKGVVNTGDKGGKLTAEMDQWI